MNATQQQDLTTLAFWRDHYRKIANDPKQDAIARDQARTKEFGYQKSIDYSFPSSPEATPQAKKSKKSKSKASGAQPKAPRTKMTPEQKKAKKLARRQAKRQAKIDAGWTPKSKATSEQKKAKRAERRADLKHTLDFIGKLVAQRIAKQEARITQAKKAHKKAPSFPSPRPFDATYIISWGWEIAKANDEHMTDWESALQNAFEDDDPTWMTGPKTISELKAAKRLFNQTFPRGKASL